MGVVGATGLVGIEMIKCLEELNNPNINIFCYASSRSKDKIINTSKASYKVEELTEDSFNGLDYVLFSGGNAVSEKYAPVAVSKGCIVIDNSSFYRMSKEVPLVSIGSNDKEIYSHKGIIANPNCSTIELMRSLKVLDELYGIKKVVVSTYQSVSGIGKQALEEYSINQHINLPNYTSFPFPSSNKHYSIKDNVIPQIDSFDLESRYTKEELKMTNETKKILGDHIDLIATCVRVPIYRGHAESVYVELNNKLNISEFISKIKEDEYLELKDDIVNQEYPLVRDCYYNKKAIIGRIRKDLFSEYAVNYFIVGDNLYLGAAYNAVMILNKLINGEKYEV